ncbi:unnamed protein product [Brassica oleracea]
MPLRSGIYSLSPISSKPIETFQAVQSSDKKKDFNVKQYTVSYVPMRGLNTSGNDCGAYSLKFIECHLLGLNFSLVNDENIQEARHKIAYDLWEAANDERKSENHLFKWIDEALIDEIRTVDAKHERVAQGHTKLEERVMENVKSEFARVKHEMSQKLKEKVNMEIARVETEMKQKLKIAAVAMVVVGAVVGIWTSLTV